MPENWTQKSWSFDDVENKTITYQQYIISEALDIIAHEWRRDRDMVATDLIYTYGGDIQIAIIDYFRNFHC